MSIEQSEYEVGSNIMRAPLIATNSERNKDGLVQSEVPQEKSENTLQQDGIEVLKVTFPDLDEEQIQTFYELNGNDMKKTKLMINQQLGIYTEEAEEGVDPNDVEFQLLAGQMDPNIISEEERKMINQALHDSQPQEDQRVQHIPRNMHAVNQAQINQQANIENQKQQMEQNLPEEEEVGSEINKKRMKIKKAKKMNQKDANKC